MMDDCVLTLTLDRGMGSKRQSVAVNLGPEFREFPQLEEMLVGPIPLVSFDQAVQIMKKRKLTGDILKDAAYILGVRLAERLEDEGGWHGEDRRDTAKLLGHI